MATTSIKPDWAVLDIEGGQRIAWRGWRRDITPDLLQALTPGDLGRLKHAFAGCGQDGPAGDLFRFDVQAWVASGVAPQLPTEAGVH